MMAVIKDFKDWKNAKKRTDIAIFNVETKFKDIALYINDYKLDEGMEIYGEHIGCRAYPCFVRNMNLKDCNIYEPFCKNCAAFEDLVEYQSLKAQMQIAQEKQEIAKQKLLDNFRFWKQKVK